jgi:O-antigen ligase
MSTAVQPVRPSFATRFPPSRPGARVVVPGLLLVATAVSRWPAVFIACTAVACGVGLAAALLRHCDRIVVPLLMLFGWWALLTVVSHSVDVSALVSPSFWEGDGKAFIAYLPFFALAGMPFTVGDVERLATWLVAIVLLGGGIFGIWLLVHPSMFKLPTGEFVGLQTSHTAAGTFWGVIAVVLLTFGWTARRRGYVLAGVAAFALTAGTGSRSGVVAVLVAMVLLGVVRQRRFLQSIALVVPLALVLMSIPGTFARITDATSTDSVSDIRAALTYSTGVGAPSVIANRNSGIYNVTTRIGLWKYALWMFGRSPITGVGFGRFNDADLRFCCLRGGFSLATSGTRSYSDEIVYVNGQVAFAGNAHNSYLQFAAETGIIGLMLVGLLWRRLYQRLTDLVAETTGPTRALGLAGQAAIFFMLVSACFGNAIAAPSVVVPVASVTGVCIGIRRTSLFGSGGSRRSVSATYEHLS